MKRAGVAFAGLGAGALGLEQAGFEIAWLIEVDPKCQEVLARHFPGAKLHSDVKEVQVDELDPVDIFLGGFPCQDISIAGPRSGLAGDRSGLFFEWARLVEGLAPEWVIVENVTGLLSSGGRRDMGAVLGTLGNLGYGFAYRVLDARHFGVPQRRRRVFVVGHLGADPRGPGEVLLESSSLSGAADPRRSEGPRATPPADNRIGAGGLTPVVLRMRSGKPGGGKGPLLREDESLTLATGNDQTLFQPGTSLTPYAVRKLMPVECERLQGLPDGWTEGQKDTPRYRQTGNAVAVPVIRWIAARIAAYGVRRGTFRATPEEFCYFRSRVSADRQHFLTPYTPDQIREDGSVPYLYVRGREAAGVLLKADGEVANLFNTGVYRGAGEDLLIKAIALGGDRVEYFDNPYLRRLYQHHGFIEQERYSFDLDLIRIDFPDFDPDVSGRPDYVIARRRA